MTQPIAASKQKREILVICDEDVTHDLITHRFMGADYPVTFLHGDSPDIDLAQYGAIVHIAHSNHSLNERLGDRIEKIKDQEWILIAGDNDDDLHCTVELTIYAPASLRAFVQVLWSTFNIT